MSHHFAFAHQSKTVKEFGGCDQVNTVYCSSAAMDQQTSSHFCFVGQRAHHRHFDANWPHVRHETERSAVLRSAIGLRKSFCYERLECMPPAVCARATRPG